MTTSNHIFTGAAIALAVNQPVVALPLALLSHFVLDALPHYGIDGAGYIEAAKYKLTYVMESFNIVGIPLLIYLLWGQPWWVWLAAGLAILPDIVWIYAYFTYERYGKEMVQGPITRMHSKIQWGERHWGILIEVPFLVCMVLLVASLVTW